MAFLLFLTHGRAAPGEPQQMALDGTDLVIGSGPECDWRLVDGVAPRHCQFGFRGGQWLLVDLGGGTAVNDRSLDRPAAVAVGDFVRVGGCVVAVADASAARPAQAGGGGPAATLLRSAGLTSARVPAADEAVLAAAGRLIRLLVAGLVDQLTRRARAKAELGAESTQFAFGAANPLKTLPPDHALAALLAPAVGSMPAERAVADAFNDLEAHQTATLAGMQGALAATLNRFSPAAIRGRAQDGGLMSRVLPGAKDAALWQAYEREFDGVSRGSSDAFVELFATEFAKAYRDVSSAPRPPS